MIRDCLLQLQLLKGLNVLQKEFAEPGEGLQGFTLPEFPGAGDSLQLPPEVEATNKPSQTVLLKLQSTLPADQATAVQG